MLKKPTSKFIGPGTYESPKEKNSHNVKADTRYKDFLKANSASKICDTTNVEKLVSSFYTSAKTDFAKLLNDSRESIVTSPKPKGAPKSVSMFHSRKTSNKKNLSGFSLDPNSLSYASCDTKEITNRSAYYLGSRDRIRKRLDEQRKYLVPASAPPEPDVK